MKPSAGSEGAGELVPAAAQAVAERDNGGAFDSLGFLQTRDPKVQHPEVSHFFKTPNVYSFYL